MVQKTHYLIAFFTEICAYMCIKKSKNSELDASFFPELMMDVATKWAISQESGPDMEAGDDVIVVSFLFFGTLTLVSL